MAIFNHGGGALRTDAAAFANANCIHGIATAAIDMVFHGGRRKTAWSDEENAIVPVEADTFNLFTGQEGQDYIGDPASGAASVAQLFAIGAEAEPLIIEANMLTIMTDTHMLRRQLAEGDWSQVYDGLSFDETKMFHQSLSFGTAFTTSLMALTDFRGIVSSVGTTHVLRINMPMAPSNSTQAAGLLFTTLGLPTLPDDLKNHAWTDFFLGLHGWLHERGDPIVWAPHVLRHRPTTPLPNILSSGNSWDETLYAPAQITYANAVGLKTLTHGDEWTIDPTIPASATLDATESPAEVKGNTKYGDQTTTSGIFFRSTMCHAQVVTALCAERFEHPYPPIVPLDENVVSDSPICKLHGQAATFLKSLLDGADHATIIPPTGTCEDLYAP